jgi:aspartyl aminopeptidase
MNPQQQVKELLDFIDVSPSPWHVVQSVAQNLNAWQFEKLLETEKWSLRQNGRYYVIRDDSSIIAFIVGNKPLAETGFKIVGAHTDSPGLRLKPKAAHYDNGFLRLGVEIYGGSILATFADRDLSLAGRVSYKEDDGKIKTQLVKFDQPLLRLPNLPIHLNRAVNEEGLKFHKQNELALILSAANQQLPEDYFYSLLALASGLTPEQILSWEINVYDTQKGSFWGAEQEFYANSQLDNLASCHAGLAALLNQNNLRADHTLACAFFDHEEVGSESFKGASGSFLADILERIALATENNREGYQRALSLSFMISADMAHAYQPNFPGAYDGAHKVMVNQGPVIKTNVNQRYSTESLSGALFIECCQQVNVPYQVYSHRCDLPCGSTIGPVVSTKLGIRTVDVGNPLWAMHSLRESAGVLDHNYMIKVLSYFFGCDMIGF